MRSRAFVVGSSAALLLIVVSSLSGFIIGSNDSPSLTEARAETKASFVEGYRLSFRQVFGKTRNQGARTGLSRGLKAGRTVGLREGASHGNDDVDTQLASIAAAQAEAARLAAEADAAERQANCGAPLFVEGYCPTDAEIAQENAAETYCGGGRYEEAAALGIKC